jgi:hypothetical protein
MTAARASSNAFFSAARASSWGDADDPLEELEEDFAGDDDEDNEDDEDDEDEE